MLSVKASCPSSRGLDGLLSQVQGHQHSKQQSRINKSEYKESYLCQFEIDVIETFDHIVRNNLVIALAQLESQSPD